MRLPGSNIEVTFESDCVIVRDDNTSNIIEINGMTFEDILTEVQAPSAELLATIQVRLKNVPNEDSLLVELMNCWTRMAPEHNFSDESNDVVRWAPEIVYEMSRVVE